MLASFEDSVQRHLCTIKCHALAFVNGESPSQSQRNLLTRCQDFSSVLLHDACANRAVQDVERARNAPTKKEILRDNQPHNTHEANRQRETETERDRDRERQRQRERHTKKRAERRTTSHMPKVITSSSPLANRTMGRSDDW